MELVILNIMVVVFPIMIYLVFSCYDLLNDKRMARLIFIITMCTSLYFSLSFSDYISRNHMMLMFTNIPLLICYFKKEWKFGIIFSLIVIIASYVLYDVNIYIVSLKCLVYFIIYIVLVNKKEFNYMFFKLIAIIQGFFISFEYFYTFNLGIEKIFTLIYYALIIYLITFFSIYMFKLADGITELHLLVNKMEKEKNLRDSLFKLTHEIKNPIAVCKGYFDMINLDNREKSEKYIRIMKSEIDRSLNIMNDFMEYSKIKINREVFDIGILIDEVYESFKLLVIDRKIKLNYKNIYDEIYVYGDFNRLKQVLVNVVKNSIESILEDGIINIDVLVTNGCVNIIVSDNGCGMNELELSNIKEMFYTSKRDGTGLGVSLSNEIILAHNGCLSYDSVKGEGTSCKISLPI